jgi:hypothetical protein
MYSSRSTSNSNVNHYVNASQPNYYSSTEPTLVNSNNNYLRQNQTLGTQQLYSHQPLQQHPHATKQYSFQQLQRQVSFTNTNASKPILSLLGNPPDLMNQNNQLNIISLNSSLRNSFSVSPPLVSQTTSASNNHASNTNYHQHQASLITVTNGINCISKPNNLNNINNRLNNQNNNRFLNKHNNNNVFAINASNSTNEYVVNQNRTNNFMVYSENSSNKLNNTAPGKSRFANNKSNSINEIDVDNSLNSFDSTAYKNKLKTSIDANRRNINQRLNLQQQNKNASNQHSIVNTNIHNNNNLACVQYHQNKQLIVIKPAEDFCDNQYDNKSSQAKLTNASQKRSHSEVELNNKTLPEGRFSKKIFNNNNKDPVSAVIHESDLVLTKNCSIQDEDHTKTHKIIRIHGYLSEKLNEDDFSEKSDIFKVKLDVFYCKLCCLILNDDKSVKEHTKANTFLVNSASLDENNNKINN